MEDRTNIPSSFSKWNKTAKLGLVSICVILTAVILLIALSSPSQDAGSPSSGLVPNDAINVALPKDKLDEVEKMLTPLLRGNVSAFDGLDSANTGEIVSALLSHICEERGIEEDETGAKAVPADEVDALYTALFSVPAPKGNIQNGRVAKYDSENDLWLFYGSEYFPEYKTNIVSTYTLGNTVYVQIDAVKPSEPVESVTSEGSESDADASDTVTSLPDEESDVTSEAESETESSNVSSEESVAPEIEYVTVRSVIITITANETGYTVTEMRDI